jgi:acyl-CoA synthetase (AMP-forming)/AMP-acid ligase II
MVARGGQNVYCIEVENKLYLEDARHKVMVIEIAAVRTIACS